MAMDDSCPEEVVRCRTMLAAMLKHVILDCRGEGVTNRSGAEKVATQKNLALAARQYVFSQEQSRFSFEWLCSQLDIDVAWFRREVDSGGILDWKRVATADPERDLEFVVRHA
jgi:hypothetical protein